MKISLIVYLRNGEITFVQDLDNIMAKRFLTVDEVKTSIEKFNQHCSHDGQQAVLYESEGFEALVAKSLLQKYQNL